MSIRYSKAMGHLISELRSGDVPTVRRELLKVHKYLVGQADAALKTAQGGSLESFGSTVKRTQVLLPLGARPPLITADDTHNLIEVVNQCATLERLLDRGRIATR